MSTMSGPDAPLPNSEQPPHADVLPVVGKPLVWFLAALRAATRIWLVALIVGAAIVSGIALNQMFQTQAQLDSLRKEPGPEAYAIVAYRQELRQQLEAFKKRRTLDAVPQPPPRPRLLEEIDIARKRNQDVLLNRPGAQPSTLPVVNAPN